MEGCLERIGEDDPDGEMFLRDLWKEGEVHQASELPWLTSPAILERGCVRFGLPERSELRLETCTDSRNLMQSPTRYTHHK